MLKDWACVVVYIEFVEPCGQWAYRNQMLINIASCVVHSEFIEIMLINILHSELIEMMLAPLPEKRGHLAMPGKVMFFRFVILFPFFYEYS